MANGWVKIHRTITEWEWYKDPCTRLIFEHLLYTANHAPARWRGIDIAPGQLVTSVRKLAQANGISEQNVRTALRHLETTGEISKKSTQELTQELTHSATLITVEKWALYQLDESELTQELTHELTRHQHSANTALTTNKNNKKEKKEKNIIKREYREKTTTVNPLSKDHEYFKSIKAQLMTGGNRS